MTKNPRFLVENSVETIKKKRYFIFNYSLKPLKIGQFNPRRSCLKIN